MVIGVELGKKDHGSTPANAIERGLEILDSRTDPQTK
jgi:hypothetical protein